MPRWIWWVPLGLFIVMVGLGAYRLGLIDAHLTESHAIHYYAERHAQAHGGVASCSAVPGTTTWLEVRCASTDGVHTSESGVIVYAINRFGGLVSERWEQSI